MLKQKFWGRKYWKEISCSRWKLQKYYFHFPSVFGERKTFGGLYLWDTYITTWFIELRKFHFYHKALRVSSWSKGDIRCFFGLEISPETALKNFGIMDFFKQSFDRQQRGHCWIWKVESERSFLIQEYKCKGRWFWWEKNKQKKFSRFNKFFSWKICLKKKTFEGKIDVILFL